VTTGSTTDGFAGLLRGWRTRRRVSQLELATRAGTTQRHVSFIESGRSVPGRAMVVRLAESLEVPLRERNVLLLAAGFAPVYPRTALDDPALEPVRTALERILTGHLPYPAVVVDRCGDLVSANAAFHALTDTAAPHLLTAPVSVPRLLLHPDGLAPRIVNLDEWAWHVVDRLHTEAVRNPHDRLQVLVAELTELVPGRPRHLAPDHLGFAVPLRLRTADGELRLITTLTHFGTAVDVTIAELRLEAFLPADEATAAALTELTARAHPGQPPARSGVPGSGTPRPAPAGRSPA
jgi:transcriptional regulator with XRE-family HTH domain